MDCFAPSSRATPSPRCDPWPSWRERAGTPSSSPRTSRPKSDRSSCSRSRPRSPTRSTAIVSDLLEWGRQLGLPRTVRILETVGRAMREMKSAPEKIVILEVAMVRLIKPELDSTIDALDERITKLERDGVRVEPASPAPPAVLRPIGSSAPRLAGESTRAGADRRGRARVADARRDASRGDRPSQR